MSRRVLPASVVCALALAGAACGGGGRSSSTAHVTRNELAAMTLPKSAFGSEAAAMRLNPDSGFLTNAQAASHDPDPRMTAASLVRAGRLAGYAQAYHGTLAQTVAAVRRGAGLVQVDSTVDLYRDPEAAAAQLRRDLDDLKAEVGERLRGGSARSGPTLVSSKTFPTAKMGDEAVGGQFEIRVSGFPIHFTRVWLRQGRLLAAVLEARADPKNVDATVSACARALHDRIESVLAGNIR